VGVVSGVGMSVGVVGVAEFKRLESLPADLLSSLPSIEQIERELAGSDPSTDDDTE